MSDSPACTVWFTGLPKSGKRTVARGVAEVFSQRGMPVDLIDSGKLRRGPLGQTLGFSRNDRDANVRRHAFAASLLARHGVVAIVSSISPYRATRDQIRDQLGEFVEVHVNTDKAVCIERDRHGHWDAALAGRIRNFTGVDDPYEAPLNAEVTIDMGVLSVDDGVAQVVAVLEDLGYLPEHTQECASEDSALMTGLGVE